MTEDDFPLHFEPPGDPLRDDEYPEAGSDEEPDADDNLKQQDNDLDDAALSAPCPHCGREIYEDAVRCPYCANYILWHHSPWSARSWWWIALGLLGAVAAILALLGFAGR